MAKGRIGEAPPPAVTLFGENARPIQVTLRLAKTRSGKPFVLAEIECPLPLASQFAETARRFGLTAAESQVLGLLAQGLSDREIAQRLFVSRETIHTHLGRLFGKLDVHSRLQAALLAHGLPPEGWQGLTPLERKS
ncbi:MAG TPA: helix-turn-helix transcriptional regulator [bacterium]|nr:helix-turn-helix transcriptional regulator [bacterium]